MIKRVDGTPIPLKEAVFWAIREGIGAKLDADIRKEIISEKSIDAFLAELGKRGYEMKFMLTTAEKSV